MVGNPSRVKAHYLQSRNDVIDALEIDALSKPTLSEHESKRNHKDMTDDIGDLTYY